VKYIDYDVDPIPEHNMLYPFVRKRKSFEYEKEVRALFSLIFDPPLDGPPPERLDLLTKPAGPLGIHVPVDLAGLIVRVRVSPVSPSWFTELVRSVLYRYQLEIDVVQSDIDGDPVY
jgi:hypothetical protein